MLQHGLFDIVEGLVYRTRLAVKDGVSVLRPLAMLGNSYELNGIIEYWRYYVGALLCSTGVSSAWKRLHARQHDRNTESRMLVHYRSSY